MQDNLRRRQRLRRAQAVTLLAWAVAHAYAQSPARDVDAWVQYPPRKDPPVVRLDPPAPAANVSDPAPAPAPTQRIKPKPKPGAASGNASDSTSTRPAAVTPMQPQAANSQEAAANPQQSWVRFPIMPTRPNGLVAAPAVPASSGAGPARDGAEVASAAPSDKPASAIGPAPKKRQIVDFTVVGNERVSREEILSLVAPQRGQDMNNDTLRQATDAVSDLYQRKGILALVEMPAQDLTSGVPQIKVTEAKFAGVVVEDPNGQLANRPHLTASMVEGVQPKGELMSLSALDEASARLNDLPGVDIKMSLRPGDQAGQTQAVVVVDKGKPFDASVGVDNAGAKSTGELRENARLTLNNPLKMGDSATFQMLHSQGMDFQRASYSLPVGGAGWRAGINTSNSNYRVIASEFQYLNARGPSHSTGVDLTIPLRRSAQDSLTLQLAADQRRFRNEALDVVQSEYRGSTRSAYLEGTHREGNQSETMASLQWVRGHIDLSGSTAAHQYGDSVTTQTEGDYTKAKLALMHRQEIDASNTFLASAQTQWASKNLDGSEKFFLGGANGVRAYPTNEAGGSMGRLLSVEWQRHFTVDDRRMTAAGFYDTGHIIINKYNSYAAASSTNTYGLSGAGVWLGSSIPNRYGMASWRLTAARRLGSNDGASVLTGLDQDGTRVLNRYRFSLNQSF